MDGQKIVLIPRSDLFNTARKAKNTTLLFNIILWPLIILGLLLSLSSVVIPAVIYLLLLNANFFYFLRTENYKIWSTITIVLLALTLYYGFVHRGVFGAGDLWVFLFPIIAFELNEFKKGLWYIIIFYSVLGLLCVVLYYAPFLILPYTAGYLYVFFAVSIAITAFLYINYRKTSIAAHDLIQNSEKYETLFNELNTGIILVDRNRKILEANRIMRTWFPEIDENEIFQSVRANTDDLAAKTFTDINRHSKEINIKIGEEDKHFYVGSNPVFDVNGRIYAVMESYQDITESYQFQKKLEFEQHLMTMLMNNIPVGVYFKDMDSCFIRVSKRQLQLFGLSSQEDIIGKSDFNFFTTEHASQALQDEQNLIKTGVPIIDIEEKETWPDGNITWVSTSKFPLYDQQGKIMGTFGLSKDITELKNILTQLQKEKEKYRLITENASDVIWIYNLSQETFSYISPSVKYLRGFTTEEAQREGLSQSITDDTRKSFETEISEAAHLFKQDPLKGNQHRILEARQLCKDGTALWVEISIQFQVNPHFETEILGITRNIDNRKKIEAQLHYKNQLHQLISVISSEFVTSNIENTNQKVQNVIQMSAEFFELDQAFILQFASNKEEFILSYQWNSEGAMPLNPAEIRSVSDFAWWKKKLMKNEVICVDDVEKLPVEATAEKKFLMRYGIRSFTGYVLMASEQIYGMLGFASVKQNKSFLPAQISVMRLIANNISDALERYQTEQALFLSENLSRQSEARYMAFVEATHTGAWEYDSDSGLIWCSPQYYTMLGWSSTDFDFNSRKNAQKLWKKLVHADDYDAMIRAFYSYIQNPQDILQHSFRMLHKNGTYIWVLSKCKTLNQKESTQNITVGTLIDISDQKRTEEIIKAKNNELETYLYVASHDLKSPLVNIQGFGNRLQKQIRTIKAQVNQMDLSKTEQMELVNLLEAETTKSLSFIFSNVKKMNKLINGLLTISRTGKIQMNLGMVDMEKLMNSIIETLNFRIQETKTQIKVHALPPCFGDFTLLSQLFSNLIDNALKYKKPGQPLFINIKGDTSHEKVIYSVCDNGIGISEQNLPRIWDIFFRIHPGDQIPGDGIGLNLVQKIAEKHKGFVSVDSKLGEGTTFFVHLNAIPN